jgi:transcriptional regulator with XRE-family HTH domain
MKNLIFDLRKSSGMTLRDFSKLTHFSFQTLSKYENGKIDITPENLKQLLMVLRQDMNIVDYCSTQFADDLHKLYQAIVFDQEEEVIRLRKSIEMARPLIQYSKYQDTYNVYQFIMSILYDDVQTLELDETWINGLDASLKQLIYEYRAVFYLQRNDINESIKAIVKSLSYGSHGLSFSMVNYHASIIFSVYGKLIDAMKYAEVAESFFIQYHNSKRLINQQIHNATLHAKLKNHQIARRHFLTLLNIAQTLNNVNALPILLHNLAWLELKEHHYLKSLDYLSQLESIAQLDDHGLFIKLLCFKETGDIHSFDDYYSKFYPQLTDPLFILYFDILRLERINVLDNSYEQKLVSLYTLSKDQRDFEHAEISTLRLIDYYEKNRFYKKALHYYKERTNQLEWISQLYSE